jgi:hypothetical protein
MVPWILFLVVVTTKTIPHSGSPLPDWTSQLLSISDPTGALAPGGREEMRKHFFEFRGIHQYYWEDTWRSRTFKSNNLPRKYRQILSEFDD